MKYNNFDLVLNIWKRQYATDFALLDTTIEQIEFLKDLLLKNKENIIEAEKLPQFVPSDGQLTNPINDEFAPHKPTEKEWMKCWDELNEELVLPVIMNQNHLSILEDKQELFISTLNIAHNQLETLPASAKLEIQKIPTISSEDKTSPKIVESKHDDLEILLRDIAEKEPDLSGGLVWELLCKIMKRKTPKYDHDRIILQRSSDNLDTLIWKSENGKNKKSTLSKGYFERIRWPAAKKWVKENPTNLHKNKFFQL